VALIGSINNKIACTPFEVKSAKTKVVNGFGTVENRDGLAALKVVFNSLITAGPLEPGDTVYVRADGFLTYGKDEFEVDGKKFILVPEDKVILLSILERG